MAYHDEQYELKYLRLENEKLKQQLQNNDSYYDMGEIQQALNLAVQMRELLQECRSQQISIGLAKRIDRVLAEARQYD